MQNIGLYISSSVATPETVTIESAVEDEPPPPPPPHEAISNETMNNEIVRIVVRMYVITRSYFREFIICINRYFNKYLVASG